MLRHCSVQPDFVKHIPVSPVEKLQDMIEKIEKTSNNEKISSVLEMM